jgi:O-antigen ligase
MKQKVSLYLLLLAVFLLPWQTRYIFHTLTIGDGVSEYGVLSLYIVEVLIVLAYVFRGKLCFSSGAQRLFKSVTVFIAFLFFSLMFSEIMVVGWFHALHVFTAFLLFSLVLDQRTPLNQIALFFVLGLLLPSFLGVYQVITGGSGASVLLGIATKDVVVSGVAVVETVTSRMLRAYGSFPHPNIFGGYIAVGLLFLALYIRTIKNERLLWFFGGLVVVLSATLIMTFSRSAWFGLLVALLLLLVQMLWYRKMPPSKAIPLMTIGLVTVLITMGVFYNQMLARFNPSLRVEATSIEERISHYKQFNDVYFSSPLLGVGPGAYVFTLANHDPGHEVWNYQPIHNFFLLVMSELGIIGFLIGGWCVWLIYKTLQTKPKTAEKILGVSLLSLFVVIGIFDHYFWSQWSGLALSALTLGVVARCIYKQTTL